MLAPGPIDPGWPTRAPSLYERSLPRVGTVRLVEWKPTPRPGVRPDIRLRRVGHELQPSPDHSGPLLENAEPLQQIGAAFYKQGLGYDELRHNRVAKEEPGEDGRRQSRQAPLCREGHRVRCGPWPSSDQTARPFLK